MPSGYTEPIKDGISFERFALQCARAFGTLILMRDDSFDTPIPDEFKPSSYHEEALKEALLKGENLSKLTPAEIDSMTEAFNNETFSYWEKTVKEKSELKEKYEAMLKKVQDWELPTTDHEGLKKFMVKQIEESIDWDCDIPSEPKKVSSADYLEKQRVAVQRSIDYHTKEKKAEEERSVERTNWVKKLKESLKTHEATV